MRFDGPRNFVVTHTLKVAEGVAAEAMGKSKTKQAVPKQADESGERKKKEEGRVW